MKLYGMWISPRGDFWDVQNYMSHEDIAREITGGIFPETEDYLPETKYLIMSGYCRVILEKTFVSLEYYEKLTKNQMEFVEIWKEENLSIIEQIDNMPWEQFVKHAEECYNFYPLVKFQTVDKTDISSGELKC